MIYPQKLYISEEKVRIFKVIKGKNLQLRLLYPAQLLLRFDGEIKSFPNRQKLRDSAPPNQLYNKS